MIHVVVAAIIKKGSYSIILEIHTQRAVSFRGARIAFGNRFNGGACRKMNPTAPLNILRYSIRIILKRECHHPLDVQSNEIVIGRVTRDGTRESFAQTSKERPQSL